MSFTLNKSAWLPGCHCWCGDYEVYRHGCSW